MQLFSVTIVRSKDDPDPLVFELVAPSEKAVRDTAVLMARESQGLDASVRLFVDKVEDKGEFNGRLAFIPSKQNWALCREMWERTHKLPSPELQGS